MSLRDALDRFRNRRYEVDPEAVKSWVDEVNEQLDSLPAGGVAAVPPDAGRILGGLSEYLGGYQEPRAWRVVKGHPLEAHGFTIEENLDSRLRILVTLGEFQAEMGYREFDRLVGGWYQDDDAWDGAADRLRAYLAACRLGGVYPRALELRRLADELSGQRYYSNPYRAGGQQLNAPAPAVQDWWVHAGIGGMAVGLRGAEDGSVGDGGSVPPGPVGESVGHEQARGDNHGGGETHGNTSLHDGPSCACLDSTTDPEIAP